MNTFNLLRKSESETASLNEVILFEQLALKKLKELHELNHPTEEKKSSWRSIAMGLSWRAFLNLFRRAELVQQVGPGQLPLEEHEWKPLHQQDQMR